MAFTPNNNFNNSNQNGGEKKKTNFRLGKIWGSDGQMDISIWVSDTGVRAILSIKSAVGKDPSTGANVLEQKMANELPRYFMNIDFIRAFLDCVDETPDLGAINMILDKGPNGKLSVIGQGNSIKVTIDTQKLGSRTITFESVSAGSRTVHAAFKNLVEYLKIAYRKALTNKLDPDEFNMAVGGGNTADSDEEPF